MRRRVLMRRRVRSSFGSMGGRMSGTEATMRSEKGESARPVEPWKPTKEQIEAAYGTTLPDVIAKGLKALFVGINPGLYTAAIGHHFGRPGNRFWPALCAGGFTDRVLSPFEEQELLPLGYGITNMVARATARADEVAADEFVAGGAALERKAARYRPRWIAVLGVTAYRTAFGEKRAKVGEQPRRIGGAKVWLLPNPSGLNAHYQLPALGVAFGELREEIERGE